MNTTDSQRTKDTVVVAGASGFVGKALIPLLLQRFKVIALSRGAAKESTHPDLEWR